MARLRHSRPDRHGGTHASTTVLGNPSRQLGRAVGAKLQETLGQPFVVENRPGANGSIGAAEVAKSTPDGYTVLMSSGSAIALNGLIYRNLGYDPMKVFEPVAPVASVAVFLQIRPTVAANNLPEFIAFLRANPARLNYGTPGNGSSPHLASELFNRAAKVQTIHVPYKGAGPALTDLLAGQIDFMFDPGIGLQYAKAGKLKLLAVGSPKRHPAYPEVPTVAEIVGSDFDTDTVFGIYVPMGTPKEIIGKLNLEVGKAMQSADLKARAGAIAAQGMVLTPEAFAARLKQEHERMAALVKEIGLRAD